jgi:hypothetical protein
MYDQLSFEYRSHESVPDDSSSIKNKQRKVAALSQRQHHRQPHQIGFLNQQRRHPNPGKHQLLERSIETGNSLTSIEMTSTATPSLPYSDSTESHGQAFNAIMGLRPHESIYASHAIDMLHPYAEIESSVVQSNDTAIKSLREFDDKFKQSPDPSHMFAGMFPKKFATARNEANGSTLSTSIIAQTMRSSASLKNLAASNILPFAIGSCSNVFRNDNYLASMAPFKHQEKVLDIRDRHVLPVSSSWQQLYHLSNKTDQQSRSIVPQTFPMHSDTDLHHLSKYQCLIRQQLEFFAAKPENAVFSVQGRKRPIRIGQVGIQCRHCCHLPHRSRGRGAVYYPVNLAGVYQAVQNMATVHLNQYCSEISDEIRSELKSLRGKRDESTSTGGKYYWTSKCEDVGIT